MKRILLIALLTLVPAFLLGEDEAKKSQATGNSEQEIRSIMEQSRQAQVKGDTAALGRLLSDQFAFTNSRGEVRTKAQMLSDLKSGAVKYEELTRDALKVRFFGDTAIATAQVTVKGQRNGEDMSGRYRGTWVLVKSQGRWQVVSAQTTPVAETSMAGSQDATTAKKQTKSQTKKQTKSKTEE